MRNEAETRAELIDSALAEEPKGGGQIVPPLPSRGFRSRIG